MKDKVKRDQNDSKSTNNISSEIQRKVENDKILNWRTERKQNNSPTNVAEENFPTIRSKNVNVSNQLNRLIVPKITNLNNYGAEHSRHKDNSNLMKELIRKKNRNNG